MKLIRLFFIIFFIHFSLFAMEIVESRITISEEMIRTHKEQFPAFISQKKKEYQSLTSWTSPNSLFGSITASVIEFASPTLGYGNVDVAQAKLFLGRVFENEELLKTHIELFETETDNIAYLQSIFQEAPAHVIKRKSRPGLIEAMKKTRHKKVPSPDKMGEKDKMGNYVIPQENFLPFALSNLMAFHILEEVPVPSKKEKKKRS